MRYLCVDACYLIALYDPRDPHHTKAERSFKPLFENRANQFVAVWPILYETLGTRMARRQGYVESIMRDFSKFSAASRFQRLDDSPYRDDSLSEVFHEVLRPRSSYRPLSLADRVIRRVLADVNVKTDGLVTFNVPDFADVCKKRQIEILP